MRALSWNARDPDLLVIVPNAFPGLVKLRSAEPGFGAKRPACPGVGWLNMLLASIRTVKLLVSAT